MEDKIERLRALARERGLEDALDALIELGWAAGFFDGEGTACLTAPRRRSPCRYTRLSLVQKDRKPLDLFQRIVGGGGSITWQESSGKYGIHRWEASGAAARAVSTLLEPYCFVKKPAIKKALDGEVHRARGEALRGIPHTPEHRAAIAEGRRSSNPTPKALYQRQRKERLRQERQES